MLVIVPFRTHGDRESNCLADGLTELLAAELSRGRTLTVKLAPTAAGLAMRQLGARYCLMGRVARVNDRVRVIVRLTEVEQERHLWGDSFDGHASDELTLQDPWSIVFSARFSHAFLASRSNVHDAAN